MKQRLFAEAIALISCALIGISPLSGKNDNKQEAEALFAKARELCEIRCEGCPPYQLRSRLRLHVQNEIVEGSLDEYYVSNDHWRRVMQVPDWKLFVVEIKNNNSMHRASQAQYPTYIESRLHSLMHFAGLLKAKAKDGKISIRRTNAAGQPLTCIIQKEKGFKTETCFDALNGTLATVTEGNDDNSRTYEYSQYSSISGKQFPRLLRMKEQDRLFLEIEIEEINSQYEMRPALFIPPHDARSWKSCDNPTMPEAISKPEPRYSAEARAARVTGKVIVYVVVGPDGRAYNATPIRAEDLSLARNTLDTIERHWQFKPATCDGSPVPRGILVETEFRLF